MFGYNLEVELWDVEEILEFSNEEKKEFMKNKLKTSNNENEYYNIFDISIIIGNDVIGGCPRQITFKKLNIPSYDIGLYKLEKNKKNLDVLKNSMNNFYSFLQNRKQNYTDLYKITEDEKRFFEINKKLYSCNSILLVNNNNKLSKLYLFDIVESDNDFKNYKKIVIEKYLPAVIACLKENNMREVNIILKHSHNFSEKGISFIIGCDENLVINRQHTDIKVDKYYELFKNTQKEIEDNIRNKKLSTLVNRSLCAKCDWKALCETM